MATGSLARVVPRLLAAGLTSDATSDAELLERFIAGREQTAFEVLVRRHGPMVFAVCRRVLRHTQDAEDAFQATFLVLAHKAATVSPRSNLAAWLHGVAHKTALKARQRAARRFEIETRVPPREAEPMHPDTNWDEVEPLLDQEIASLPDHYRLPIVLCDLEDRPRTEVAGTLGCSEGTLSSRLTRGRRLLAERLNRRGVSLSVAALVAVLTGRTALAEPLIRATVPVALAVGTGGAVSPSVAELATGVMKSMFLKKLRAVALVAVAVCATAFALAGVAYRGTAAPVPANAPVPATDPKANTELLADTDGRLLMNRKVLKDLKCDFEQFDKIMDVLEEANKKASQKAGEAMGQLRINAVGGPPNIEAIKQQMQEAQEAGEKEFRKVAGTVMTDMLTAAQKKRFREIDLQARGHDAFTTPTVVKALEITDKQKQQLEANAKQVEDDVTNAFQRPAGAAGAAGAPGGAVVINSFNSTDFEKVVREARAEGMKRALTILTDEQKAAWKKLSGEPFAYPLPLPTSAMKGLRTGGFGFGVGGAARPIPPAPPVPPPPAK